MKKKILVSCVDAGGANIINHWIKKRNDDFFFYLKGPAKKIFKKKNIKKTELFSIRFDEIITGTSTYHELEKYVRKIAIDRKIYSTTFLDHYINYYRRFLYKKKLVLPNQIYTFDKYSTYLAKKTFKRLKIKQQINYFEKDILKRIKRKRYNKKKMNILFISEIFLNNKKLSKMVNLKFVQFLKILRERGIQYRLKYRKHPSEKFIESKKITKYLSAYEDKNFDIIKSLNWSDMVIGYGSYYLMIANKSSRDVFTLNPIGRFKLWWPLNFKLKKIHDFKFKK